MNPWTIRARILEVDSMHIKPTGEVFAELACNGKVSNHRYRSIGSWRSRVPTITWRP